MARPRPSLPAAYCIALIGLVFTIAAIGQAHQTLAAWQLYYTSKFWTETPVQIESLELKEITSVDSEGHSRTSYILHCSYTYNVSGKEYHSTVVGPEGRGYGDRAEEFRRHDLLEEYKENNQPYLGLVNPENPSQSLLFRTSAISYYILPPVLFLFSLMGFVAFINGIWIASRVKIRNKLIEEHVEQPWLAEPDYNLYEQKAGSFSRLVGAWVAALLLLAAMSIFTAFIIYCGDGELLAIICGLAFLLVAVAPIRYAMNLHARYVKYGVPTIRYTSLPVVLGSLFKAELVFGKAVHSDDGLLLTFSCTELVSEGIGEPKTTTKKVLWSDTRRVYGNSEFDFSFDVPEKQPTEDHVERHIEWLLTVSGTSRGESFQFTFDHLPVYKLKDEKLITFNDAAGQAQQKY